MKTLIIFLGESFRLGSQNNRNIGTPESYDGQMKAGESHNKFIRFLSDKNPNNKIEVFLATYNTPYYQDLKNYYEEFLVGENVYDNVIGYNNLFHETISKINTDQYDIIISIRIDILLKDHFFDIFDINWETIRVTFNVWFKHKCGRHPRIGDFIYFIPKKYFSYLSKFVLGHETWQMLIEHTDLTYDNIDVMINTYHDSDTEKDFNPLYCIVNRPHTDIWHTQNENFDKNRL